MDSPQVGELWRVFQNHYRPEDFELLRAGTLGIVIAVTGAAPPWPVMCVMACVNNGRACVIEVGPASRVYWGRVEEEDE